MHRLGDDAAVAAHVQPQQVVVDQSQRHLSGELGSQHRHIRSVVVGLVVEVVHVVHVGAVVRVGHGLGTNGTECMNGVSKKSAIFHLKAPMKNILIIISRV